MDRTARTRAYYECLDTHDYERLASILAAEFVHDRPDLTLSGRERFVEFMRAERPDPDTTHVVEGVYRRSEGVAVTGRLLAADGSRMTAFLDVFDFDEAGAIREITTYTRVAGDGGAGDR